MKFLVRYINIVEKEDRTMTYYRRKGGNEYIEFMSLVASQDENGFVVRVVFRGATVFSQMSIMVIIKNGFG